MAAGRLFCAEVADASDLEVGADDPAEVIHRVRELQRVEFVAFEVPYEAAARTDVVVVLLDVGVETHAVLPRSQRGQQAEIGEQPQRSVDGVERHGRRACLHRSVHGLGARVLEARCDGLKDLEALVGQLDPCLPGSALEPLEAPFDFFAFNLHE